MYVMKTVVITMRTKQGKERRSRAREKVVEEDFCEEEMFE